MPYTTTVNTAILQEWVEARLEPKAVEDALIAKGFDAASISDHLKEFNRIKNAKRLFAGFFCMGLGAVLGFLSCVITLINPVPELYGIILYGLTSVAILIIFTGLYLVFE